MTMKEEQKIPAGYKSSPVGPIPEDWEVKKLGEVCPLQRGFDLPSDKLIPGEYPVVYSNGILNYHNTNMVKGPGVVTGRSGTIGKVTYIANDFWPHNTSLWVTSFNGNDVRYIFYLLQSLNLSKYASGSGVPTLNRNDLHIQKIAIPKLLEQRKIAEILGTWDKAIELQTALIEKLTLRKKGLMQQLLTSKKRLPGFSEPWKHIIMREVFDPVTEKNDGKGHMPMTISAKMGLVSQEHKFERVVAGNSLANYTLIKAGDFAYNKGNSNLYEMGCIYRLNDASAVVPFVYICFRSKNETLIDGNFYQYFFANHGLDQQLKKIITSGARGDGLLNVDCKDFFSLQIPYPSTKEQCSIAQILTTVDQEIEKEKQKLEALKQQKKGLMQQLLTGKKRVIIK